MNIGKFIAGLLPSFSKRQIDEDLKVTRSEVDESLPAFRTAKEFFLRYSFKSKDAEDMQKRFVRETGDNRTPNFVVAACRLVETVDANLSTLEKLIDRYFAEDVLKEGMTYIKANLLQYVELMTFSVRFSRHLVLWTYQVESNKVDPSVAVDMSRGELKYLEDNAAGFFKAYPLLTVSRDELEKTISRIPDALISEDSVDVLSSTVGLQKLDPFQMNFVKTVRSPIYHIAMAVAEWQAGRYKLAVEESSALEMRLMHLRTLSEGNKNPKLEQLIAHTEERVHKLKAKILKTEDEMNG